MKRLSLSLMFLALATVFICKHVQAQDLNSATLLTRCEQYDKAQTAFEQLIQKDPKNSKNYFFLGENYLSEYLADTISNSLAVAAKEAKALFEKGVAANPNDPLNYIGLAKVAYYLNDDKTADEMRAKAKSFLLPYKKIKKIVPPAKEYAFALAKIAESYIRDNKVDTSLALPLIREAVRIDSRNKDIFLIAGNIYILVNDGKNSIRNYNLAQDCDPQSPTANMKIGNLYVMAGNLMAAIPYFEEAIKLNAVYAPAYRELGQLYSSADKFEKSREYFKKYLELTQGNIPAKIRYVTSLFYAKQYDEVIKNVDEILAVDKSRTYLNRIAGYSCYDKKPPDYDKALAYMDTFFKNVSPERIIKKDYQYLARILLGKNQNYTDLLKENERCKSQLERVKTRYKETSAAASAKFKSDIDSLTSKVEGLALKISKADLEIDRAFAAYAKLLAFDPKNNYLLNEIAINYYRYNRFEEAARTWARMIDLGENNAADYMQVGKAYYIAEKYKTADSVFNITLNKYPDYIEAYIYDARACAKMDPGFKSDLARSRFEKVLEKAKVDSAKNANYMTEACDYLGYYHLMHNNYNLSQDYYNRMINVDADSKENKVRGYNGLGAVEIKLAGIEKTIEGRLSALARASDYYKKVLAIDPKNESAEGSLKYIQDYEAQVRKGINPNEIRGIVRNVDHKPIEYASVRVKDTAAETYTNARGEFKFEIPRESQELIISAKGYKPKEVPVKRPLRPLSEVLERQ